MTFNRRAVLIYQRIFPSAKPSMSTPASLLIDRVRRAYTSPTVLFYLPALPASVLRATDVGTLLLDACAELGLSRFDHAFSKELHDHARRMIPVENSFYVCSPKKDRAVAKFREAFQRRRAACPGDPLAYAGATCPLCIQFLLPKPTDGKSAFSGSLFFIFSAPEMGLRMCVDILRNGYPDAETGQLRRFTQAYEIRLRHGVLTEEENRNLGYLILDWEVEETKLRLEDGSLRLERHEVETLGQEFPLWFYRKMLDLGAVSRDALVAGKSPFFGCVSRFITEFCFDVQWTSSRRPATPRAGAASTRCTSSSAPAASRASS